MMIVDCGSVGHFQDRLSRMRCCVDCLVMFGALSLSMNISRVDVHFQGTVMVIIPLLMYTLFIHRHVSRADHP